MLNGQLQKQIEQEAIDGTKVRVESEGDVGWNQGYERGYEAVGEKYAEKWQEAEQRAERYEKALKEIANLTIVIGSPRGNEVYKIATKALTPKTGSDDTANG